MSPMHDLCRQSLTSMPEPTSFDYLPSSYWDRQVDRVNEITERIRNQSVTSAPGRRAPDGDDLVIGTGRRLDATVMFVDISGFSARRSNTVDEQELILRVLNLFMTEMIRIIEEYGGHVEKNTGDGLLAYFEDGIESEKNSVKRAVACVLTMQSANQLLISPVLRNSNVVPIDFRTTIEYGSITVARIGARRRFNANVAIGSVANFAASMLSKIQPGEIGIGASAHSKLPNTWREHWAVDSGTQTGWVYIHDSSPYPLYIYTGCWRNLQ